MINTVEEFSKKEGSRPGREVNDRLKRRLARIGRSMFSQRLEIGLGLKAVAVPFVRPTIATEPLALGLKAAGLCLVLTGLGVRVLAAGFAGRHTRSSKIEGSKLAIAGPYAHVRNPIYLGSVVLGFGKWFWIGTKYCREIVAAHGGQMWLDQQASGWTAFIVTLSGPKSEA